MHLGSARSGEIWYTIQKVICGIEATMNRIIAKRQLSENVFRMDVEAPLIAQERKPGQLHPHGR